MSFLNIILLGGLTAASIPLIIHLLHRSRFRVVKWGAMHLLDPLQRTQRINGRTASNRSKRRSTSASWPREFVPRTQ